ncbi:hypothetical protein OSB04_014184 [Centaurea solstitialis]|uniref:Uncharacterized protein n=1 Tax=Centaurea solstitialis TaxID=347529 RepID=A0AA38SWM1_9ASTR|nr:hypothetical protein OSB04_014184 [Centaurea solstitialis]
MEKDVTDKIWTFLNFPAGVSRVLDQSCGCHLTVNYPRYPSSTDRAMRVSGELRIGKARQSPSNNLELHFRPEDPYSHPVFGELYPCNNFLLKISKHNMEGGPSETDAVSHLKDDEAQVSEGSEDKINADIVGRVSEAYYFNGMVDYQHVLAVHADVVRRKKRNWADVEPQFEKRGLIDADQEDLMIILPPLFSVKNIPENVVLKPSMDSNSKKKQEGDLQHPEPADSIFDYMLPLFVIFVVLTFIHVPKKVKWETVIQEGTDVWNYQMAVCELFDERPIWIKQSLSEHLSHKGLKIGDNTMKMCVYKLLLRIYIHMVGKRSNVKALEMAMQGCFLDKSQSFLDLILT